VVTIVGIAFDTVYWKVVVLETRPSILEVFGREWVRLVERRIWVLYCCWIMINLKIFR